MFKITIFYSVNENDWFDMAYYTEKHVPLSKSVFGDSLKGLMIEEGNAPDVPYKVIGHLFFEELDQFYDHFLPNKKRLEKDAENYTNVEAVIQISKVVVWEHFD